MKPADTDPYRALEAQLARLDEMDARGHPPTPPTVAVEPVTDDPAADLRALAGRRAKVLEPRKPITRQGPVPPPSSIVEGAGGAARVEAALQRIDALEDRLNAFVFVHPHAAQEAAESAGNGPLSGWPIAHKDLFFTAGQPTTAGSDLLRDHVPEHDATVVARLRRAGAVSVGKLATHEFATGITGTVSAFGPTRNPWDTDRIPGGSSCGSAAAVAAGLIRGATATDTGGSIRIPAACCGVVGFKPGYGTVPTAGVIPFSWSLDHVGPIARTVTDARTLLAAMRDHTPETSPPAAVRIGVPEQPLHECRPDVADALERMAGDLRRIGHHVATVTLPPGLFDVAPVAAAIFLAEGLALHRACLRRWPDRYRPETVRLLRTGEAVTGERYVQALRLRRKLVAEMGAAMRDVDVILCPALPMTAPHASADTVDLPGGPVDVRAALTRFTRPFNVTGQPALVVPCGADDDGMPIAAQLVGRAGEDAMVLALGSAYQEATDWLRWPRLAGARSEDRR